MSGDTPTYVLSRELSALDAQLRTATDADRPALEARRAEVYAQHDAALSEHVGQTAQPAPMPSTTWRHRLDAACAAYVAAPGPSTWQARQDVVMEGVAAHARWLDGEDAGVRLDLDGARLDRASLVGANLVGARLVGARLDDASLVGARLDSARLVGASLDGASLDGARLVGASLDDASLDGASLDGARLDGASLVGASLARASLDRARLDSARLDGIRDDIYRVLAVARGEVPHLLRALRDGRIDGSVYEGDCACLVGTLARARACHYTALGVADDSAPAERWFLAIRRGDTPATSQVARITEGWIVAWLGAQGAEVAP